jgi:hypothetical protein
MSSYESAARLPRAIRLSRDLASVAALIFLGWAWVFLVRYILNDGIRFSAIDAHAYWSIDLDHLYSGAVIGDLNAFLYSPAAAQALAPAHLLPWPVFYALWEAILLGCLVWLVGPIAAALLLLVPQVWADVGTGNIHLLLAVAIVVGFRYPGSWAAVLLTKFTSGVALVWFAAHRQWRQLAWALGVTAGIALASFAIAPANWFAWFETLASNTSEPPRLFGLTLLVRLPLAFAVAAVGGIAGWRWTVPLAATIGLPVLWENSVTLLLGAVPLIAWRPLQVLREWPWPLRNASEAKDQPLGP